MAVFRSGAHARGPSSKPNRNQRFFSAVFQLFLERGEWSGKEELRRHLMQTGTVEFCKSWPRPGSHLVRIEEEDGEELVVLTVAAIAQIDGAQAFVRRFIGALHVAIDQYQRIGPPPVISLERLRADLPGLDQRQARCLMRLLECEGLLKRGTPDAVCGVLTAKVANFTEVEDRDGYLREKRRTERGRRRRRAAAFVRRVWSRVMGPDSSLWVKLASGGAMLAITLVVGVLGGLFGDSAANGRDGHRHSPQAGQGRLQP